MFCHNLLFLKIIKYNKNVIGKNPNKNIEEEKTILDSIRYQIKHINDYHFLHTVLSTTPV